MTPRCPQQPVDRRRAAPRVWTARVDRVSRVVAADVPAAIAPLCGNQISGRSPAIAAMLSP